MTNDLQTLADSILSLTIKIQPDLDAIEAGKDTLREATTKAGEGLRFSSILGMVETRKGATATLKGKKPELNVEAYEKLSQEQKHLLLGLGVVTITDVWSKESKPAVTVRPIFPKVKNEAV